MQGLSPEEVDSFMKDFGELAKKHSLVVNNLEFNVSYLYERITSVEITFKCYIINKEIE